MITDALALRNWHGRDRAIRLRAKLPMLANSDRTWIQVALEDRWEGHPSGAFEFGPAEFDQIIRNFERQANPLPLTFEHPERGTGNPVPAAGWILELKVVDGALKALVEFTKRAAELIRAGEYRYCSGVFDFASTDRKSADDVGAELFEIGLTNTPFIDGMEPITLSRHGLQRSQAMSDVELLKKAIKELGPEADLDKIMRWIEAQKAIMAIAAGEDPDAPAEEEAPAEEAPMADEAAASRKLADEVPEADGVELQSEEAPEAAEGMAAAALEGVASALGVDLAGVIALFQSDPEGVASALGPLLEMTPEDGTPAEEAGGVVEEASAALSRAQAKDLRIALSDSQAKSAELAAKVAEQEQALLVAEVHLATERGHVLDNESKQLLKLTKEAPAFVREQLAEAAKSPAVPTAPVVKGPPGGAGLDTMTGPESEEYQAMHRALSHLEKDPDKLKVMVAKGLKDAAKKRLTRQARN